MAAGQLQHAEAGNGAEAEESDATGYDREHSSQGINRIVRVTLLCLLPKRHGFTTPVEMTFYHFVEDPSASTGSCHRMGVEEGNNQKLRGWLVCTYVLFVKRETWGGTGSMEGSSTRDRGRCPWRAIP